MGRFFETAPTQFVEDFIYQPPWEIIQQNNMLKAQNYATQQQTFNLLNNLPVDFWDKPDSELAKAKQEEYRNLTEPLIKTLQKDPNNKQAEMQLHDITNKLYQDYTYGDLAKLRTNKEQHDKFMEYTDKLAPGDKEVFLRQMDNYLKPNQDGSMNNALTKQFDFMEHQNMIKGEDFFKTDRFKTLEADIDSSAEVNVGGQWLIKTSSNIEELKQAKIAEEMKAWIQEQNLDKNNWDKYWTQVGGIQNLYDKEGKLGFEKGTYFGDMIESGSKTHAYKKTKSDKDVDINKWTMHEDDQAFEARESEKNFKRQKKLQQMQQEVPQEVALLPEAQKKVSTIILEGSAIRQGINNDLETMGKKYGLKINIHSIPQLLKWATNNNKIAFKNSLLEYQDRIQKTYKASLDPLYSMGYSKEYVDKYYTNLQKNIKTKGLNVPGILDLEESGLGTISKKISLSNLQGKTLGGYKVESAQLVQDSSLPLILSPDENYNKIQSTVKLKISKGKDVKEVYVDYYQDSVDISGRTNLNN